MRAQARYIEELFSAREQYCGDNPKLPIVFTGDMFNHWRSSPELINFLLKELPNGIYGVPGNHDLPLHNYADIKKSAYWTLVEAGKITNIEPDHPLIFQKDKLILYGFPHGHEVKPASIVDNEFFHLAVVHDYIWIKGCGYPGAELSTKATAFYDQLSGYDVAVFGDNHMGFRLNEIDRPCILNGGAFICRSATERQYHPFIGVIRRNGTITQYPLDLCGDQWAENKMDFLGHEIDMTVVIESLNKMSGGMIDFAEAVNTYLRDNPIPEPVAKLILESLEEYYK